MTDHKKKEKNVVSLIEILSDSEYKCTILKDHRGEFDIIDSDDLMIVIDKDD